MSHQGQPQGCFAGLSFHWYISYPLGRSEIIVKFLLQQFLCQLRCGRDGGHKTEPSSQMLAIKDSQQKAKLLYGIYSSEL